MIIPLRQFSMQMNFYQKKSCEEVASLNHADYLLRTNEFPDGFVPIVSVGDNKIADVSLTILSTRQKVFMFLVELVPAKHIFSSSRLSFVLNPEVKLSFSTRRVHSQIRTNCATF